MFVELRCEQAAEFVKIVYDEAGYLCRWRPTGPINAGTPSYQRDHSHWLPYCLKLEVMRSDVLHTLFTLIAILCIL